MSSLVRVDHLFEVHRASSGLFGEYEPGSVAYVSNASDSNGVVGFVEPLATDTIFSFTGIVVNSFSRTPESCGARIQTPPFVACGRSGNGLLVLEPRLAMTNGQLVHIAAYMNRAHGWRFTWYRQATKDRFKGLSIPSDPTEIDFRVSELLPHRSSSTVKTPRLRFRPQVMGELFDLQPGEYHTKTDLPSGTVPLVSCGDEDHGVVAYVDAPEEHLHTHCLTIALNGRPLTTKFHPYNFAAKDDVAVAIPRFSPKLSTLLFIQMMLNRERWRYSYYRKCFIDKLRRSVVPMPFKGGELDEQGMAAVIATTPYWDYLAQRLARSRLSS